MVVDLPGALMGGTGRYLTELHGYYLAPTGRRDVQVIGARRRLTLLRNALHFLTEAVALRFTDSSVASIAYGSTPSVAGKERIEVLARSHQMTIDDFRSVKVNGHTLWKLRRDKGYRAHAGAFRQAMQGGTGMPAEAMLGTMRAIIQAASRAQAS